MLSSYISLIFIFYRLAGYFLYNSKIFSSFFIKKKNYQTNEYFQLLLYILINTSTQKIFDFYIYKKHYKNHITSNIQKNEMFIVNIKKPSLESFLF